MKTKTRSGITDFRYANFLKISVLIKKRLQKSGNKGSEVAAESIAYELSELIPSDVLLDEHLSVSEILDWADKKSPTPKKDIPIIADDEPECYDDKIPSAAFQIAVGMALVLFVITLIWYVS